MPYSMSPANGRVNRVERLMINMDTALPMQCSWPECERRARTPYQVRTHEHPVNWKCDFGRHSHMVFCSEYCLLYWVRGSGAHAHETAARRGGRIWGNLHPGDPRRYR
jgi:hypothetical protein